MSGQTGSLGVAITKRLGVVGAAGCFMRCTTSSRAVLGGKLVVQLSMGSLSQHARLGPTAAICRVRGGQESDQPAALSVLLEASVLLRLLVPMPRIPAAATVMVLKADASNDCKSEGGVEQDSTTGLGADSEPRACMFSVLSL